jgi:hypothetical protein
MSDEKILVGLGEYLLNHRDEIMSEWLKLSNETPRLSRRDTWVMQSSSITCQRFLRISLSA